MSKYYVLSKNLNSHSVFSSLKTALFYAENENFVFKRVDGIPNPWFAHPVVDGKVNKNIILNGAEKITNWCRESTQREKELIIENKLKDL